MQKKLFFATYEGRIYFFKGTDSKKKKSYLSKEVRYEFQCQFVAKLWAVKVNGQKLIGSLDPFQLKPLCDQSLVGVNFQGLQICSSLAWEALH